VFALLRQGYPGLFFAGLLSMLIAHAVALADVAAKTPEDLTLTLITTLPADAVAVRQPYDESGRLFLVEQRGRILIFDGDSLLSTPFLDIQNLVDDNGGEQGLLGLAFHPDYVTNGYFYLNYTYDPGPGKDRTRIVRYQVSAGDPDIASPASASVILEIEQDFSNHNGGDIHFGPDGYLYIGMGDGGSGGDPNDRARDLTSLLGKMLRIDIDGPAATGGDLCGIVVNYAIPGDNPYQGSDPDDACDETWSYGLRNPWRWSFDRVTSDLLIGDVGQIRRLLLRKPLVCNQDRYTLEQQPLAGYIAEYLEFW
jgi:glucose/arabinose dehydrogenase